MTAYPCVGLNLIGAMPTDRGPFSDKMLKQALEHDPVVIEAVEADDVDLGLLPRKIWAVRHRRAKNLDGVLLAVRRDVLSIGRGAWLPGAPASPVNDPRPILRAPVWVKGNRDTAVNLGVFHRPKKGGERAANVMDRRVAAAHLDQWYSDRNQGLDAARRIVPGVHIDGQGVVFVGAHGSLVDNVRTFDVVKHADDDDHRGILFDLHLG